MPLLAVLAASLPSSARASLSSDDVRLISRLSDSGIREGALRAALDARHRVASKIRKGRYLTLIDFRLHSSTPRLFLIDLKTGKVEALLVSHGAGSDPDHSGYADRFSNVLGSKMSSLGAYVTESVYYGKHGLSLRLVGLDRSNDRAEERAIVMHGADYVGPGRRQIGRSWGCPALEPKAAKRLIPVLAGGSFVYVAH